MPTAAAGRKPEAYGIIISEMAASKISAPGSARPHSVSILLTLLGVAVSAASVWVAWLAYSNGHKSSTSRFPVVVLADNAEGNPVYDAEVNLNLPELNSEQTDVKGQVFFMLGKELVGREGRLTIHKNGFENYNRQILIEPRSDFYPVYLKTKPSTGVLPQQPVFKSTQPKLRAQKHPTGSAHSEGDFSPAMSGSGNTVNYGSETLRKKEKAE